MKSTERLIFHIDVNSAFLSWESAQKGEPGTAGSAEIFPPVLEEIQRNGQVSWLPNLSLPGNTGSRPASLVAMALRKCPELVIVPSDFALI